MMVATIADGGTVSLDPEREPITRPVFVWLEIAALLTTHGDSSLAVAIGHAMNDRLGESDPD